MRRPVAILAALGLALIPATANAYTVLTSADQTGNGVADTWIMDDNGDGVADRMLIDANESGIAEAEVGFTAAGVPFVVWLDANLDGIWDSVIEPYYANAGTGALMGKMVWLDTGQDGGWDHRFYDGDLDNYYEWVMVDSNYDGVADVWRANSAPAGHTATDVMARQVASVGAVNILHAAGLSVFFPSSTIPLGG